MSGGFSGPLSGGVLGDRLLGELAAGSGLEVDFEGGGLFRRRKGDGRLNTTGTVFGCVGTGTGVMMAQALR